MFLGLWLLGASGYFLFRTQKGKGSLIPFLIYSQLSLLWFSGLRAEVLLEDWVWHTLCWCYGNLLPLGGRSQHICGVCPLSNRWGHKGNVLLCSVVFIAGDCVSYYLIWLTAERHGPAGQGYCQGGFSADFTKVTAVFDGVFPVELRVFRLLLCMCFTGWQSCSWRTR